MNILNDPRYHAFVKRYAPNPLLFVLEVCGNAVSPDQIRLLEAIADPTAKVSVVSGTGTGKTNMFGRIAIWHLLCFPVARYDGKT